MRGIEKNIIEQVIKNVTFCYNREQAELANIGKRRKTEGEIRQAAGELVEHILQNIFDTINGFLIGDKIVSKIGTSDYLSKSVSYKGKEYHFNTIQVDRHILFKGVRIAFIENKTYLDSCYYDRALADFRKIVQSLKQHDIEPSNVKYIVFAGQKAANEDTLLAYTADFCEDIKHLTANPDDISVDIFYFLEGTRSSAKPLYKVKHQLNTKEIKRFVRLILSTLK